MPDKEGRITEEERSKALAWLNEKAGIGVCSMCGTKNWILADTMPNPPTYTSAGTRIGGITVPMVGIFCAKCGHLVFFSAIVMGLIPAEQTLKEQKPSEEPKTSDVPQGVSNG